MRPELLMPVKKQATPQIVQDVLALAEVHLRLEAIEPWTELELALAYDWAVRVHLGASDNPVKQRPKPSFVEAAEKAEASRSPLRSTLGQGLHTRKTMLAIIASHGTSGATAKLIMTELEARDLHVSRETVQRWLRTAEHDNLIELHTYGRWRMRAPVAGTEPAPRFPDREHIVNLNAQGAARLRAWLARPNGSLTEGRAAFESVSGGGIMVRTRPYQVDEQLCDRILELLRGSGLVGLSPHRIAVTTEVGREAVMTALRALRAAGEAENYGYGAWRSTVKQPLHARDYEEGVGW